MAAACHRQSASSKARTPPPEAVVPTVELLEPLNDIEYVFPDTEDHEDALDRSEVPEQLKDEVRADDTVLFGSASETYTSLLMWLRNEYGGGLPANVRPVRYMDGAGSPLSKPEDIDYVIVRENFEGLYARSNGDLADLVVSNLEYDGKLLNTGENGAFDPRTITEEYSMWVAKFACELAADRSGKLTCGTKSIVTIASNYTSIALQSCDRVCIVFRLLL